ncbi:hypothetical protein [Bauldia sp.]|uniref:hypothetical protein n=1 Tax=Bauldia sp. TaxID=2575872 RepID=UPI003BAA5293
MDKQLAKHLIRVAFRSQRELSGCLGALKEGCSPEEYRDYARGVAAAVHEINVALTNKAIAAYPELEQEIESDMQKYGRYL